MSLQIQNQEQEEEARPYYYDAIYYNYYDLKCPLQALTASGEGELPQCEQHLKQKVYKQT